MRPYQHEIKYYECDRMGITHHSNYIRLMEEARVDWMDQIGYGFERMEKEGVVSPVIEVQCQYRKPTTFKDVVDIEISVAEVKRMKVSFTYTMRCRGEIVCTAHSTHCFLENNRPVALEDRFPELYQKISGRDN